jgi:hypothetical protein
MQRFVRFFLIAAFAVAAFGADVDGKWKATFETPDGQKRDSMFDFKAEGSTLNGTLSSTRGESKIQDGKIEGDTITFNVIRNFNGQDFKMGYTGKLAGDEIKLKVTFGEGRTFDMLAKREK